MFWNEAISDMNLCNGLWGSSSRSMSDAQSECSPQDSRRHEWQGRDSDWKRRGWDVWACPGRNCSDGFATFSHWRTVKRQFRLVWRDLQIVHYSVDMEFGVLGEKTKRSLAFHDTLSYLWSKWFLLVSTTCRSANREIGLLVSHSFSDSFWHGNVYFRANRFVTVKEAYCKLAFACSSGLLF